MIKKVVVPAKVRKAVLKLPMHIQTKFQAWVQSIEDVSLEETRKCSGFHDESVMGSKGQRSARMSVAYRAYYRINTEEVDSITVDFVKVEAVDKHKYRKK